MFSASTGVSSNSFLGSRIAPVEVLDIEFCDCSLIVAACFFFCSSISESDAAIAALRFSSSSSIVLTVETCEWPLVASAVCFGED